MHQKSPTTDRIALAFLAAAMVAGLAVDDGQRRPQVVVAKKPV